MTSDGNGFNDDDRDPTARASDVGGRAGSDDDEDDAGQVAGDNDAGDGDASDEDESERGGGHSGWGKGPTGS
ncbi:MAG: hypothetical protein JOZ24_01495 [Candidatus Eremiobacteraeota bacterium]|nr:hypothetical protein [Candidatus Eremiobacteraeota bacterium]